MEGEDTKKIQEVKTDLNLLLECLKYHMNNPSSQREALFTIYSICQQNSNASVYFRDIGGLMFVRNLAKSSGHSMVKEAALYTLGAIAEANVYCQQSLCTSELFEDLVLFLSNDSSTNLKRMSVYVVLVLVSNNRNGQTLVRETGCIAVLSQLFKTVLSNCELNLSDKNVFQSYQLWSSVCSTLCVCVNNPQNEENQMLCCSLFPHATEWLINYMKPEIIRPICSFIGLTLANNTYVQKYFISVRGLDILSQVLVQLESDSHKTPSCAKLAVMVIKTVDACIADNPTFGVVLSKYNIVSKLLALLPHESLDSGEKFSIMLALGHCTEDCEENQYDLFKNNGLPLMIQALAESQNEELNKAATFVLYNCKKITEKLSLSLGEYSFDENEAEHLKDINMKEKNLEEFRKRAKEILHKIELLEGQENEENMQREKYNISSMKINDQDTLKYLHADSVGGIGTKEDEHKNQHRHPQSCNSYGVIANTCANNDQMTALLKSTNPVNICYRENGQNKAIDKGNSSCKENLHEEKTFNTKNFVSQSSDHAFKHPAHVMKAKKQQLPVTDPFTLCSDIINKEAVSFQSTDCCSKTLEYRCSGCIAVGKTLNSRNFSKLLQSCSYQCDRHKVIVEAEDRYKSELRKSLICNKKILLTPHRKGQLSIESTPPKRINKRRIRKNFSKEEITYLFHGVKKMGNHWNSILWSFPFQQGRTAVDLARKYHNLVKHPPCTSAQFDISAEFVLEAARRSRCTALGLRRGRQRARLPRRAAPPPGRPPRLPGARPASRAPAPPPGRPPRLPGARPASRAPAPPPAQGCPAAA
ncbi:telomere repeats-binding bouquet formation protein 1 [Ctenodactylus gundi]